MKGKISNTVTKSTLKINSPNLELSSSQMIKNVSIKKKKKGPLIIINKSIFYNYDPEVCLFK